MSIILYSGTPGSYKSYHAVQECLKWLKDGKNLITNFPLIYKKRFRKIKGIYEKVDNMQLTVDYLVEFAIRHHKKGVKAQTLIVIDEASIKFNSREFNNKDRMEWIKFLANHRHFNFDIILIAQQDRMIDRQIRSCIETEYKHRALKNYGFAGSLLNLLFHGCYMCIEYWYPVKSRVGSDFGVFNARIANCYDTMGLFVDSNNKMSVARQRADEELEKQEKNKKSLFQKILQRLSMKRGVTVYENRHKKQVKKDLGTFVDVLSSYVVRNTPEEWKKRVTFEWALSELRKKSINVKSCLYIFHDRDKDEDGMEKPLHAHAVIEMNEHSGITQYVIIRNDIFSVDIFSVYYRVNDKNPAYFYPNFRHYDPDCVPFVCFDNIPYNPNDVKCLEKCVDLVDKAIAEYYTVNAFSVNPLNSGWGSLSADNPFGDLVVLPNASDDVITVQRKKMILYKQQEYEIDDFNNKIRFAVDFIKKTSDYIIKNDLNLYSVSVAELIAVFARQKQFFKLDNDFKSMWLLQFYKEINNIFYNSLILRGFLGYYISRICNILHNFFILYYK